MKPIPNKFVQSQLQDLPDNLDGELIVGSPTEGAVFNRTSSGVMSIEGEPDFLFHVFDDCTHKFSYFVDRLKQLRTNENLVMHKRVFLVPHYEVHEYAGMLLFEEKFIRDGYEGMMIRDPNGYYKEGRSTFNELILLKYKRFTDGEAIVMSVEEGVHNTNGAQYDAVGAIMRSSKKEGLIPNGAVGCIIGKDVVTGAEMRIAPGRMTKEQRLEYFKSQDKIVGHIIKYRAFEYGAVNTPRFPTFQGFRHNDDM
jgi:DNA ligase-1